MNQAREIHIEESLRNNLIIVRATCCIRWLKENAGLSSTSA